MHEARSERLGGRKNPTAPYESFEFVGQQYPPLSKRP